MGCDDIFSVEDARELVLSHIHPLGSERVNVLDACGRVCAKDVVSDIDVSPFDHSAMDGYALRANELSSASASTKVKLEVVAEIGAGDVYDGELLPGQCIRIMTGAELPACCDAVVKYEEVECVEGNGKPRSIVAFNKPTDVGSNIRHAGEDAKRGDVVVSKGELINEAGAGFLASCGALEIDIYKRPRVAIIATGSELVSPSEIPLPGHIRESNSYAISACVRSCGAVAEVLPIVKDTYESLYDSVMQASKNYDFVITTGGAANGDFDFIKPVIRDAGELFMTLVNMRPGKAQTFGLVGNTLVFGLPGNPAAAYCGFQMLIRPALRKMQGYQNLDLHVVKAHLASDVTKKDPRRLYMRSVLSKLSSGEREVLPAKNQSSGLFSTLQRGNCLAVIPEGQCSYEKGSIVDCVLLDVSEDAVI